jgi:PAS domain S-box-containing protein
VADVLATGKVHGLSEHTMLLRRDGVETPIADSASPIVEEGVILGVVLTFRDVTEDRARADALRAQREQLTALLASTAALVYSAKLPDFTVDFISPSAHELLGFTPDEMTVPGFWNWAIHPDDRDRVLTALPALFVHGRHVHEYRHRHKQGGYRWLRDEPRLVYDDAGRPLRAIGASFDITARKRDEQRLAALYAVQQVVSRVSRAFLATPHADPAAVLREPLAELGAASHAQRVYVCLGAGVAFEHAYEWCAAGVAPRDLAERRARFASAPEGLSALRGGIPLQAPSEAATDDARAAYEALCTALGVARAAVVPMMVDGVLRGVVGVDNAALDALEADELTRLLRLFADAVAAGLRRAENERALQGLNQNLAQRAERQHALFELSTGLALASDRAIMWKMIRATLRCFFKVERFSFGERDGATGDYTLRMIDEPPASGEAAALAGADAALPFGPTMPGAALDLAGTAIAEALETGVPVTTRDRAVAAFRDWSSLHARRGYNQFVVIPLLDSGGSFATLNVSAIQDAPPDLEDISWIEQVAIAAAAHLAALAARESLRALNRDLEDRVALRTRELQQSEERFERLFQYAPQAMLIVDAAGRVSQSNRNAQALFGYSDDAFVGLPVSALVPHAVRERHAGLQRSYIEAGSIVTMASGRQVSALRSDETPFMAEVGLVPLRLNGEQSVLVGVSDVSDRVAAQAEVTRSLREKETLLKEIHHRVKNNLQIISSLLMLQADQSPSAQARAPLEESVHRVRSMALIHEQLYGSDTLERIELGTYARQLVGALRGTLAPRARVTVRTTPVEVSVETAVPVGLILNELLTNAFKYGLARPPTDLAARPGRTGPDCDVLLEVGADGDTLRLAVSDSGPGLAPQFATAVASTLGLQLVRSLTRQLRGTLSVASDEGTQFTLVCPLRRRV